MPEPPTLDYAPRQPPPGPWRLLTLVIVVALLIVLPAGAIALWALRNAELPPSGGFLLTTDERAALGCCIVVLLGSWLAVVAYVARETALRRRRSRGDLPSSAGKERR